MKKWLIITMVLLCLTLWGCSKEPPHEHTFSEWAVTEQASCTQEGTEKRLCADCGAEENRPVPKLPHTYAADNVCDVCWYVDFAQDGAFVELGNVYSYPAGDSANSVWSVKIWNGKIFRGAGNYNNNSGNTPFLAYDIESQRRVSMGVATDEAIQRFIEIDGTLYAPGIDSTESWNYGNFYVLNGETWQKMQTLPNGLHNFDMIAFDGKIFAGLGTENVRNTVAVSQDKGESFTFVPMYRDGALLDVSDYEYSRTYAFVEYSGRLYALVTFKKMNAQDYDRFVFRYENGNMVYQSAVENGMSGKTGENYWQGRVEWNGICYLNSVLLHAVTDFSKPETHRTIPMPNNEVVADILLYDDELYVLSFAFNADLTSKAVIYKSATGEEGSFTEVVSFNYSSRPLSFDFDGDYFYVGTGTSWAEPSKSGMLLRVSPILA